jgi:hypothetical protein
MSRNDTKSTKAERINSLRGLRAWGEDPKGE